MSELESAASLFGSSGDSSKDPFASNEIDDPFSTIGSSDVHDSAISDPFTSGHAAEASLTASASETPFYSPSQKDEDVFGSISDQYQADPHAELSPSVGGIQGETKWSGVGVNDVVGENHAATAAADFGSGISVGIGYESVTSMQTSPYGQEHSGYSQNGHGYGHGGYLQNLASESSTSVSNSYDPYVSQAGTNYAVNTYEPYAPKQASSTAPMQNANGYIPANTYTPTVQSQASQHAFSANLSHGTPSYVAPTNSTYPTASQTLQAVPPPPAPKAPLNRPKVSNAYDPPFPMSSSTRKTSRNTPSLSSAFSAYASPPLATTHSVTSPYASSYTPPQVPASAISTFHQPNTTTSGTNFTSFSQGQSTQSAGGGHYLPPSQEASVDPYVPQRTGDVHSSLVTMSVPPPPRSSFSPPPRSGSAVSSSRSPPNTSSPLARIASPPQGPPRNASPTALVPFRKSSMQMVSAANPPPASNITGMSSSVSVHSLRTGSPSISSVTPLQGMRTSSPEGGFSSAATDPYTPNTSHSAISSTVTYEPRSDNTTVNPYLPKTTSLESARSVYTSPTETSSFRETSQYLPKAASTLPPAPLNGPSFPSEVSATSDPYAPSRYPRKQMSESDYGSYSSRYDYPNQESILPAASHALGLPQEVKAPTHAPYAPSPSLLGTNDPLGRTSVRVPVFTFGFGGKIVTCFHGADKLSTGFDVALASRNSTGIQIRVLNKIVPESVLDLAPSFPGPLFSDPGTPTTGLVRTGASTQTKNKKTRLLKYLNDRAEEISLGLGYLHTGSPEKRQAEGKLILVKLLKTMVEHDGKLLGSPEAEVAVRNALVPDLDLSVSANPNVDAFVSPGFSALGEDISLRSQLGSGINDPLDPEIQVSTLRPSSLDKIQVFLLRGEKCKAYHYALDQKLWAHAMVIASGIDKEAWKEAVNEFLRSELGSKDMTPRPSANSVLPQSQAPSATTNGREGLRVAYSLFSGQGAAAVQELIPHSLMSQAQAQPRLGVPITHTTPMTPNFVLPPPAANIPPESLCKWAEMVAMMLSGTMNPETSSALTALGDQLSGNQWVEAGHVCYLLSPQTSPIGGMITPAARVILLGAPHPQTSTKSLRNTDTIIFSEILEFALGLNTPMKGHEPFHGLPHLQAFRLIRAIFLAEIGEIALASRYCEAITASMHRSSPYFTPVLSEQLRGLTDRIAGTAHSEKSNSWVGNKLGKPSLDSIGGWLEGRFTKLVTGDSEEDSETRNDGNKGDEQGYAFSGPFSSQYSAMSSTNPSNDPSPQSSVVNLNSYAPPSGVPGRTGSSMSNRSLLNHHSAPIPPPQERAASAMDYGPRRKASPGPRIASASAYTTTFAQSRTMGQARSIYSPPGTAKQEEVRRTSSEINEEDEGQEVSWWGSSGYGGDDGKTPRTATFVQLGAADQPVSTSEDGLISLMDNNSYVPQPSAKTSERSQPTLDEDEEDLGFGNSKPKSKPSETNGDGTYDATEPKAAPQRPDVKPAPATSSSSSGSWLGRWWRRESTPGPVKANLGEEKSFYYDKELKRWVNKSAEAAEAPKPGTPPPPPSRAQTASPGMSGGPGPRPPSAGPPPPRSASVADVSGSGPPPSMRIRSNLVPSDVPHSVPSTPTSNSLIPPNGPPSRPRSSQAAKRNVRSRYVDVFQQQEGAA